MSVDNIGATHPGTAVPALMAESRKRTSASLEGQIRQAREQLNDWVTCVSATTPKGHAEIQSLSAQISAAQEQINRLQPASTSVDVWA